MSTFEYLCHHCGNLWRAKAQTAQCPNCHEPSLPMAYPRGRQIAAVLALSLLAACGPVPRPPTPGPTPAPKPPDVYTFDVSACEKAARDGHCLKPIPGATIRVNTHRSPDDNFTQVTNADGYTIWTLTDVTGAASVFVTADGFVPYDSGTVVMRELTLQHNLVLLLADRPPLPPPPTRDELLDVHITFQGLTVETTQYGRLPWFEAALPYLSPSDRQAVYRAKHASTAWPGGDSHALVGLPSGPPLYDEPGQPYSADRFGALDWTAGNTRIDPQFGQLIAEVVRAGFTRVLLFLNGDAARPGYFIARAQLPLVLDALEHDPAGDLRRYVCIVPGWDGVWHTPNGPDGTGWAREDIIAFGQQFRALYAEGCLALEHASGYIPIGEGGADFAPGGGLTTYDLILSEFDGPRDSAWRRTEKAESRPDRRDYNGNQIWQIAGRLSATWQRPDDEPADADSPRPPSYTRSGSPRGPYRNCAFEWVGEYLWVRDRESAADIARDRAYFKTIGYGCGG